MWKECLCVCVFLQGLWQKKKSQRSREVQHPIPGGRLTKTWVPCCPSPKRSWGISTRRSTRSWPKCCGMSLSPGRAPLNTEPPTYLLLPFRNHWCVSQTLHLSLLSHKCPWKICFFIYINYFLSYKSRDKSKIANSTRESGDFVCVTEWENAFKRKRDIGESWLYVVFRDRMKWNSEFKAIKTESCLFLVWLIKRY